MEGDIDVLWTFKKFTTEVQDTTMFIHSNFENLLEDLKDVED
jgi:hypothetical protein